MSSHFNITPQKITTLPQNPSEFIQEADQLVDSISSKWSKTKTYNYTLDDSSNENVTTYHTKFKSEHWVARISQHSSTKYPFQRVLHYLLGIDSENQITDISLHTKYEEEYIKVLNKWEIVPLESYPEYESLLNKDHLKNWYSVKAEYELGAPLKTRQFDELIFIQPPTTTTTNTPGVKGYVISLVADDSSCEPNVRGVYSSIERIELKEDGKWEWIMCTTSDAGGSVPKWLQNSMISKSVAIDVPGFLNWFNEKEKNDN
ncbi:3-phytase A [Wickerhamomyces ciferrii]|uniref:3-phytase A n=1 Tax=Wickerhamomyces ciferrii (strain ATCC 14091 / BCRC 22168 / CBS 111 / JCM 3599 / NBRC 0793 / NRRL Y-1031 F-60-10) TaxID=1206466 RepID=K0KRV6_WICCF|nr:3-phytase A [Wickerhamomyces ciferrii]CCH45866.1 3-phytase A [Wickerhamomyces ciferrii]